MPSPAARCSSRELSAVLGKAFAVTGGPSGIGLCIGHQLARTGARRVMASRSETKALSGMTAIRALVPGAGVPHLLLDPPDRSSIPQRDASLGAWSRVDTLPRLVAAPCELPGEWPVLRAPVASAMDRSQHTGAGRHCVARGRRRAIRTDPHHRIVELLSPSIGRDPSMALVPGSWWICGVV